MSADKRTQHIITPMPWATAEERRLVRKTSCLVDQFLSSRQARDFEPASASLAVHVFVGEHVEAHGHRHWERIEVERALAALRMGVAACPAAVLEAWTAFLHWLVARGWLAGRDCDRLCVEIDVHRDALLREAS